MKISYIREMKRSYLTIETEDEEQREKGAWEAGMLEQNRIRGLLPMRVRYEEGREIYCYDITSRQPLERILETHAMTGEQVRSLFWQLYRALEEMEKYLLESGGILLTPELIYAEPERFEIGLCAVPGGKGDFAAELSHFLQYLLKHVDHRDKDCVVLAYGLYQESLKENYGIEDLVKIVAEEKTGRPPQESGQKAERIDGIQKTGADEVRNTSGALQKAEGRSNKTALPRQTSTDLPQEAAGQTELCEKKRQSEKNIGKQLLKRMAATAGMFSLISLGIWFLRGTETLLNLSFYLVIGAAAAEIFTILAVIFWERREKKPADTEKQIKNTRDEEDPWRILYEDEEGAEEEIENSSTESSLRTNAASIASPPPDDFQTTVLSVHPEAEECHCLTALHPEISSIEIPYYPFVIGKHKELADYVLDYKTVSRFHLRLDRTEGRITVTDLNSTNGTTVSGVLLAANETAELNPGDEVRIADLRFVWK